MVPTTRRIAWSCLLALLVPPSLFPRPAAAQFVDATSGPLGDTGQGFGVAWGDYDADGDADLYLSNSATVNRLLRNDGGGVFTDVTTGPLGNAGSGRGSAWGDYDNDGDLDLFVANDGGSSRLLRNEGGDVFVDATGPALGAVANSFGAVWGDFDNDGDLDLFVVNSGQANRMWRNDGAGAFTDVAAGALADDGFSFAPAVADYDNDGDLDIYLPRLYEQNLLLRNDGGFAFAAVTDGPLGAWGGASGAAWADYDNDGDLDLAYTRLQAPGSLLRNDGNDVFVDVASGPLADADGAFSLAWADWDNDGDQDMYLGDFLGANQLARNDGGIFADATSGPLGDESSTRGVAWADYDLDGDLDLYFTNAYALEPNKLLRNEAAGGHHWLQVRLRGTVSNRDGIGARIRVVAGGLGQVREVLTGNAGYLSQNDLVASFGLGARTAVDSVIVRWPSGIIQVLQPAPAVDQRILVVEGAISVVGDDDSPSADGLTLDSAVPNPFNPLTLIAYRVPEAARVRLAIFDLAGKRVRTLVEAHLEAGAHTAAWNGDDDAGNAIASGVYLCRLEAGSLAASRRLTLLR